VPVDEHADSGSPSCCTPADARIARRFDLRASQWTDAPELPAMVDVSARLHQLLDDVAVERPAILELGSGTGALSVTLLIEGARSVTGIDLSPRAVDVAQRRAEDAGLAERATFRAGNAAHEQVEVHDWVVLDRSICCFHDADGLLDTALRAGSRRVALSVPESRGWRGAVNRLRWHAENVWDFFSGGCPGYVHDVRHIERRLAEAGFRRSRSAHHRRWYCAVYDR